MLKTPLLPVLAAAVLLSGCASLASGPADMSASRVYPDSRDVVWKRILAKSAEKSMFIRQADIANGLITVDRDIVGPQTDIFDNTIFDWAECPRDLLHRPLSQRIEINYVVRQGRDGRTTVTLNARFGERVTVPFQPTQSVSCTSTGELERALLDSFHYDDIGAGRPLPVLRPN